MHRDGVEEVKRELRALRWIADTVNYAGATRQPQNSSVMFLQKMSESFQNESFVFIVLVNHSWSRRKFQYLRICFHFRNIIPSLWLIPWPLLDSGYTLFHYLLKPTTLFQSPNLYQPPFLPFLLICIPRLVMKSALFHSIVYNSSLLN
ncbi:hypothetical protein GGU11DRAFT_781517 [Lentinula aff. detonsa]|nr:hypothetical protein GGU11DRAFT_781517 [Lentinula aff. detonsa]